ncbi:hypothetical protein L873DRAFT_1697891 [Choiromyces venosus 120613-1]|uniref:HTH psq-type domain-containing protein n=1 Tax=Choiromyces venosus 120613-1 TaxID=1336337 RepID=A0A3N4JAY8_9PEZI|nr:hypothetical protein L873DRAFT_1697891 [Choiromyces venosus 120613-1]
MSENYVSTEARIQDACLKLSHLEKPNIAQIACKFGVPEHHLQVRASGWQSRLQRPVANKQLSEAKKLAVYLYLKRLDSIGTSVRLPMVTSCTNAILKCNHELGSPISSNNPPPTIGPTLTPCFLE